MNVKITIELKQGQLVCSYNEENGANFNSKKPADFDDIRNIVGIYNYIISVTDKCLTSKEEENE